MRNTAFLQTRDTEYQDPSIKNKIPLALKLKNPFSETKNTPKTRTRKGRPRAAPYKIKSHARKFGPKIIKKMTTCDTLQDRKTETEPASLLLIAERSGELIRIKRKEDLFLPIGSSQNLKGFTRLEDNKEGPDCQLMGSKSLLLIPQVHKSEENALMKRRLFRKKYKSYDHPDKEKDQNVRVVTEVEIPRELYLEIIESLKESYNITRDGLEVVCMGKDRGRKFSRYCTWKYFEQILFPND